MKINKFQCDYCNKEYGEKEIIHIEAPVGKSFDPSGNGSNIDYKFCDLCLRCTERYISDLYKKFAPEGYDTRFNPYE